MSTRASIKAWLLGRPEPRRPARRITTLAVLIFTAASLTAWVLEPRSAYPTVSRIAWWVIAALAAALAALFAHAWYRSRKAHPDPSTLVPADPKENDR